MSKVDYNTRVSICMRKISEMRKGVLLNGCV